MLTEKSADRLRLLQQLDPTRAWKTVDEERQCILCDQIFRGSAVKVRARGLKIILRCPTRGCAGTPSGWVQPGDPLISDEVWEDWNRVIRESENDGSDPIAAS